MRIPKVFSSELNNNEVLIQNIKIDLQPIPYYESNNWQDDEKLYIRLIKKIEKMVRHSYEYKNFIAYLKEEIDMNNCSFFNKLTREDISIEIHHAPLTLFEIVSIVFSKNVDEYGADNINVFDIAEEVIKLHYENYVGLIPLSLTVHELVHTGEVFIPIQSVYGKIKSFYNKYEKYFTKEQKDLLKSHIETSKQINNQNYKPSVLERKFTYINIDGFNLPKKIESKIEKIS